MQTTTVNLRHYDFLCTCGDGRWAHLGKLGRGACTVAGCNCEKFEEPKK